MKKKRKEQVIQKSFPPTFDRHAANLTTLRIRGRGIVMMRNNASAFRGGENRRIAMFEGGRRPPPPVGVVDPMYEPRRTGRTTVEESVGRRRFPPRKMRGTAIYPEMVMVGVLGQESGYAAG